MNNLIKVRMYQPLNPQTDIFYIAKHRCFNPEFRDHLYEREEYFRSKFITFVNDAIGDEWHVRFTEVFRDSYLIDVYAPTYANALIATNIIIERFAGKCKFEGEYKGSIEILLHKYKIAA